MILSIVIPVYNIERYVKKCIHSILDFAGSDALIEIIAINDGSTDNSLNELKSIDDKRLRIIDQPNAGVGNTRNKGLEEATGTYIWFIDPDDYLRENFIMEVYDILIKKSPELLLFGINWVGENTTYGSRKYPPGEYTVAALMDARIYDNNVWSKVISKKLLDTNEIKFIDVTNGQDFDFCIKVLCHTEKICIPNIIGYNYLIHPDGASKKRSKVHLEKFARNSIMILDSLKEHFKNSKETFPVDPIVLNPWFNNYLFGFLYSLYRFKYDLSFIEKEIDDLYKNGHYPITTEGLGKKQQLFLSIANRKSLFLTIVKVKRFVSRF
jgi:glycosyltransferase involved in cell wall biosynthesis